MKVIRQTPQAINKPLVIFGVERVLFCMLFIGGSVLVKQVNVFMGAAFFVLGYIGAKTLTRKDPRAVEIWRVRMRMPARHCAFRRIPYQMEIGE